MLEYRPSVRNYIRAPRQVLELSDLSRKEEEAIREVSERLFVLL